jgi:hypothetical protein
MTSARCVSGKRDVGDGVLGSRPTGTPYATLSSGPVVATVATRLAQLAAFHDR